MTDYEISDRIAIDIMGWTKDPDYPIYWGSDCNTQVAWNPCFHMDQAWQVAKKLLAEKKIRYFSWDYDEDSHTRPLTHVYLHAEDKVYEAVGPDPARATCVAALAVIGVKVPKDLDLHKQLKKG